MDLPSVDGVRLDVAMHSSTARGRRGTVVLAHGINADMGEGGLFVRLAERLADLDFDVLRFSFRGHGASGGSQRGTTVAGEMLDLQAVLEYVSKGRPERLSIVAASFGAVSTSLCLPWLGDRLDRLVLWNPVLDPYRTFIVPELPRTRQNFGPDQQHLLSTQGFLRIDDQFEVGWILFEELRRHRPLDRLLESAVSTLIVHGDRDTAVSYDIAKAVAAARPETDFHTVYGSDHGFGTRQHAAEAIRVTAEWLSSGIG
jgi:alpha-beta hydrolase superfamily lysophospholipase